MRTISLGVVLCPLAISCSDLVDATVPGEGDAGSAGTSGAPSDDGGATGSGGVATQSGGHAGSGTVEPTFAGWTAYLEKCLHELPADLVDAPAIGAFSDGDWLGSWANLEWDYDYPGVTDTTTLAAWPPAQVTLEADTTLDPDEVYLLGLVHVPDGVTLTIPAGTVIRGEGTAALVVERGGRIDAQGSPDAPIVFTSNHAVPNSEDWGGIYLLGDAPNAKGEAFLIGHPDDERNRSGGSDLDDSSGIMSYVRIEYSGAAFNDNYAPSGLNLSSVGAGTVLDHISVIAPMADCFEFSGGTVSASHLVCEAPGLTMCNVDDAYQGTLSYLFGRQHTLWMSHALDGFHCDGTGDFDIDPGFTTEVTLEHATLCADPRTAQLGPGAHVRRRGKAKLSDVVILGYSTGVLSEDSDVELLGCFIDAEEDYVEQ